MQIILANHWPRNVKEFKLTAFGAQTQELYSVANVTRKTILMNHHYVILVFSLVSNALVKYKYAFLQILFKHWTKTQLLKYQKLQKTTIWYIVNLNEPLNKSPFGNLGLSLVSNVLVKYNLHFTNYSGPLGPINHENHHLVYNLVSYRHFQEFSYSLLAKYLARTNPKKVYWKRDQFVQLSHACV